METLRNDIEQYALLSRQLEPSAEQRSFLHKEVNAYLERFLEKLPEQKAYEGKEYERRVKDDFFQVGNGIHKIEDIVDFLKERVDHPGLNPASAGHLGYIPGGGIYPAALGDYIAAVTNRYAGVFYASPGAVRMENALIDWVGHLIGYTEDFAGNLASGGSMANLIAIATARTAHQIKGKDLEKTVIYTSRQAHHSVQKALLVTGLGECIVRYMDTDEHYRMKPETLIRQIEADKAQHLQPFLLVVNAGSTDTGAVDPLDEMSDIARTFHLWLHVDAAYGGFFLLTDHGKQKLKGIEKADSVILDPHKGLFLPYGLGIVMVKNKAHLLAANRYEANYMLDTKDQKAEYDPADFSPELSKHFRGMRMWLPLKLFGTAPFKYALEEKLLLARYFYEVLKKQGFELGTEPDLSVVTFRYLPPKGDANEFNEHMIRYIREDGRVFISSTLLNGQFTLRLAVLSFRTHLKEIDLLITLLNDFIKANT